MVVTLAIQLIALRDTYPARCHGPYPCLDQTLQCRPGGSSRADIDRQTAEISVLALLSTPI